MSTITKAATLFFLHDDPVTLDAQVYEYGFIEECRI
jgi:hypothetical protein